jgi:hypothetical protein
MKRAGSAIPMVGALAVGLWAQAGPDPDPKYTVAADWATLPPNTRWGETSAVASDGSTITVAKDGKPVDVIRGLGRPHWITMDPSGALCVADLQRSGSRRS